MKIFSNFDTNLDHAIFAKAKEEFGDHNVLFVRRDKIYLILKVYIPLIIWLILVVAILLLLSGVMSQSGLLWTIISWTVRIVILWSFWLVSNVTTKKLIDYYMDYTIITPEWVTQYDQTWVFERSTRALDITKVKTVSVQKKWLLCSIFNYWSIVFFSEWDSDNGDIKLNFITDPIKLRDMIANIVREWVLLDQRELWKAINWEL